MPAFVLESNSKNCGECGVCETVVPGFMSTYHGRVDISEGMLNTEEVQESIQSLMGSCPSKAIELVPII